MNFNTDYIINKIKINEIVTAEVLRLDLIDEITGGNKLFKLLPNIKFVIENNLSGIITYGGANSNYLLACAKLCDINKIQLVVLVKGYKKETSTIKELNKLGAKIFYLENVIYNKYKNTNLLPHVLSTQDFFNWHIIPEGGNNALGIRGCEEILKSLSVYDYVCCAVGSGCTFKGLLNSKPLQSKILGIAVDKNLNFDLHQYLKNEHDEIKTNYVFNGFAGYDLDLVKYKTAFENNHQIPLDYIYTNKLFYAINDLANKNYFKTNSKILIIHSGGLQGNSDFEKRYQLK